MPAGAGGEDVAGQARARLLGARAGSGRGGSHCPEGRRGRPNRGIRVLRHLYDCQNNTFVFIIFLRFLKN